MVRGVEMRVRVILWARWGVEGVKEEEEEDEGVVQGNGEGEGLAWLPPSQDESPILGSSRSDW